MIRTQYQKARETIHATDNIMIDFFNILFLLYNPIIKHIINIMVI